MKKQITYFYTNGSQWIVDIPGHPVVKTEKYSSAVDYWKVLRAHVGSDGIYRANSNIPNLLEKPADLQNTGT